MLTKEQILANIENDINSNDRPWKVTVEGDQIIADWKWMDATFFGPTDITKEVKEFKFIVTLLDKGKWKELDISSAQEASVGKGGLNLNRSGFMGHQFNKSITFGLGKNNQTGEKGLQVFKFSTNDIKLPIREYLKKCGWKKKGLF